MSFIRTKKFSNGRVYYYLVESYRDDQGKGKQRVLKYLGKNPNCLNPARRGNPAAASMAG
ncbi:hypothetical protein ES705_05053 [subsurface metagenome]